MTINLFQKAVKSQTRLRMAIMGPAGYGKTLSALKMSKRIAERLAETTGEPHKIALIDTEGFSASNYAGDEGVPEFDVLPMPYPGVKYPGHHPLNYVAAIKMAEAAGYKILIIDSLSHEWNGEGGCLELVDRYKMTSKSQNAFTEGWSRVTPWHREVVQSILTSPMHIIATMRSSQDYVLENGQPKKIGMGAEQRKGMDYEFSIVLDMFARAKARVDKTRCSKLESDLPYEEPGAALADIIVDWMMSGEAADYEAEVLNKIAEATQSAAPSDHNYMDLVNGLIRAKVFRNKTAVDKALADLGREYDPAAHDELLELLSQARV